MSGPMEPTMKIEREPHRLEAYKAEGLSVSDLLECWRAGDAAKCA